MADDLYDYYGVCKSAKDVWDALNKKYDTEEAGAKKYVVSRYLKYQMTDDRSVEAQSHELQKISHEIFTEDMPLNEKFQVVVITDKLPPSWKDFKNLLRHKTKEFSLESLITCLRIEEEVRKEDKKDEVLVVSDNNTKKKFTGAALKLTGKPFKNQNRPVNKKPYHNKNGNPSRPKNQRPPPRNGIAPSPFNCYRYGGAGHMARKCRNNPIKIIFGVNRLCKKNKCCHFLVLNWDNRFLLRDKD